MRNLTRNPRATLAVASSFLLLLLVLGCEVGEQALPGPETTALEDGTDAARSGPNVVDVTAEHQAFEMSTRVIGAGWTTFRFRNRSHAPHFMVVEKMPVHEGDQKTVDDSRAEVVPVFQNIMDSFRGEAPSFPDAGSELPPWYGDVVFVGGPGLTSAGETSATRVRLEPGTYVVECYVKTEDGTFHSTNGMIEGLTVTEGGNRAGRRPAPSARVTISSEDGIRTFGQIRRPGVHTVEVEFEDQTVYGHALGHDVHLVRLGPGADLRELDDWMSWAGPGGFGSPSPGGLASPEPAGVTFLGGVQDMPGGSEAYVRTFLRPGDYAWIAEVPEPAAKGMLVEFSVDPGVRSGGPSERGGGPPGRGGR